MTPEARARIKARTKQEEGAIPWLYRDSAVEGNATCAIGHLVVDLAHANALPFHPPITAREWFVLMAAPRGCRASFYQTYTLGRLADADMDALLDADLDAALAELRERWREYDAFPEGPQEALLDMAFNMGMTRLLTFSHLCVAVYAKDWLAASCQCHRVGISYARNAETAALFLAGVQQCA